MNKILIFVFFQILLIFVKASAQNTELFIPVEIQKAITNGTRSLNGLPGNNYWQNQIDYKIEADFNPQSGKIAGKEVINFKNNSPGNLYYLVVNLYPDLFKKGNTRDRKVVPSDVNDGVLLKKIKINQTEINISNSCSFEETYVQISLPKPLFPKTELIVEIEWEFTMQSKTTIRVGKYGDNTWFIGYWYPQIAVCDDLFGWDEINYDGLHEFYSAYANFDVSLKAPSGQIVWATGIWQNPSDILYPVYLARYEQALKSETVVHIVGIDDLKNKITKPSQQHIWHFKAENVSDFSFATSDKYLWDGLTITTDKTDKKETFIQTAYNKNSLDFFDVIGISKKTIQYLSDSMPGVPFPYPRMTVFNGGGGMEFPMMVNDRSETNYSETLNLTSHEISHTYFPFYVGINQERYSWMDEGWAQFIPADFQEHQVSMNEKRSESAFNYALYAGNSLEMPMMVPSFFIKGYEYYIASYYRPQIAYMVLQNHLGEELFKKALQEYIKRWNGKNPSPYDFFFTFNDVSGQDLSWFWKPWFFEMTYPDLSIGEISKSGSNWSIDVKMSGKLPLPIDLKIEYTDGTSEKIIKSAEIWKDRNDLIKLNTSNNKTIKNVVLGNDLIPDINKRDNRKTFQAN